MEPEELRRLISQYAGSYQISFPAGFDDLSGSLAQLFDEAEDAPAPTKQSEAGPAFPAFVINGDLAEVLRYQSLGYKPYVISKHSIKPYDPGALYVKDNNSLHWLPERIANQISKKFDQIAAETQRLEEIEREIGRITEQIEQYKESISNILNKGHDFLM